MPESAKSRLWLCLTQFNGTNTLWHISLYVRHGAQSLPLFLKKAHSDLATRRLLISLTSKYCTTHTSRRIRRHFSPLVAPESTREKGSRDTGIFPAYQVSLRADRRQLNVSAEQATLLRTKPWLSQTSHRPAPSKPQKNPFIAPPIVLQTYQATPE